MGLSGQDLLPWPVHGYSDDLARESRPGRVPTISRVLSKTLPATIISGNETSDRSWVIPGREPGLRNSKLNILPENHYHREENY